MARAPGSEVEARPNPPPAPQFGAAPGKDDNAPGLPREACVLGRLFGFAILAGPAVAILAAVVLLPEYAAWKEEVYQRDLVKAQNADLEALKAAQERMLAAACDDVVFIKRLAMWNLNWWPTNEQVLDLSSSPPGTRTAGDANAARPAPAPPPGMISLEPSPRPPKPDDVYIRAAARLADSPGKDNAPLRRGLLIVAGGLMLFAVLLFGPAPRRGLQDRQT